MPSFTCELASPLVEFVEVDDSMALVDGSIPRRGRAARGFPTLKDESATRQCGRGGEQEPSPNRGAGATPDGAPLGERMTEPSPKIRRRNEARAGELLAPRYS